MLGLALVVVCGAAKANVQPKPVVLTKNYVINTYIDAMTRGKLNGMNEVLDQNVKFSMLRGKQVLSFGKKAVMDDLNSNKNVEQNCITSTSLIENNPDMVLVKVDMKYDNSVRSNYVTLVNAGDGWKITNVYSVFKDAQFVASR